MRRGDLLLAGAASMVALIGLEIGLRLLLDTHARARLPIAGESTDDMSRRAWLARDRQAAGLRWNQSDALLGWRPLPGIRRRNSRAGVFDAVVSTNASGLRGAADVPKARRPGTTRIAIFGCSQTFGGVVSDDETYAARLQAAHPDLEVLNFGVHGYGTDQMLLYWERDGRRFAPDVVILAFAWYHVPRNLQEFRFFAKPRFVLEKEGLRLVGIPVPTPEELAVQPLASRGTAERSVLLRWVWGRLLAMRERALYTTSSPAWALTLRLIQRFATSVEAAGARMVLVNIEEDMPVLERSLGSLAEERGITFVNAGPRLRALHASRMLRVSPDDGHFNAEAHRVLAEVIDGALALDGRAAGSARADGHPELRRASWAKPKRNSHRVGESCSSATIAPRARARARNASTS